MVDVKGDPIALIGAHAIGTKKDFFYIALPEPDKPTIQPRRVGRTNSQSIGP